MGVPFDELCTHPRLIQEEVLSFFNVATGVKFARAARSVSRVCHKEGKLAVGVVNGKSTLEVQLTCIAIGSIVSLEVRTDQLAVVLMALSQGISLRQLCISSGTFEAGPWRGLCKAVGDCKTLRTFSMENCNFSSMTASAAVDPWRGLCKEIGKSNTLRTFSIASCPLTSEMPQLLGDCLKGNMAMIRFAVTSCSLGNAVEAVFEAIAQNTTLKTLDLSGNGMNFELGCKIKAMLSQNETLTNVLLAGNNLRACGIKEVFQGLSVNHAIKRLSLKASRLDINKIGNPDRVGMANALASALQANTTLELLDLTQTTSNAGFDLAALCIVLAKRTRPLDLRL